jgi:hypothetical protein
VNLEEVPDVELYQAAAADRPIDQFFGEKDNDHHSREEIIHQVLDTLDRNEKDVLSRLGQHRLQQGDGFRALVQPGMIQPRTFAAELPKQGRAGHLG